MRRKLFSEPRRLEETLRDEVWQPFEQRARVLASLATWILKLRRLPNADGGWLIFTLIVR